jgi:quercetin dioxygenase-like cupin family protein
VPSYKAIEDLRTQIQIPKDGTQSQTVHQDRQVKVVLLGLAGGQELSRHSVASAAMLQVLQGQVRFTMDGEEYELSIGSWIYMEANVSHAVYARTDAILLLTLVG